MKAEEILATYKAALRKAGVWAELTSTQPPPPPGKRSEVLWKIENACLDAGMTTDEILTVVKNSRWNKFKGQQREDAQLRREIKKIISERLAPRKSAVLPGQWDGDAPPPEPEWLVERCIMKTGIGILSGRWGTGKTYIAIDLCRATNTGQPFAGREVPERCGVLYLAAEGAHTILRRFKVAREIREIMENQPFFMTAACPMLTAPNALEAIGTLATATDEEMQQRFGARLGLIIIDTLMVAAGWDDENKNAEVQAVMRILRSLSDETNTFVLAIDHHGKDASRGTRGASDKESSADLVLSLTPGRMTLTKCRVGPQGAVTPFELKVHTIQGVANKIWTECTVEWGTSEHRASFKSFGAFRKAMQVTPTEEIKVDGRTVQAVSKADVRNVFCKAMNSKSPAAVRNAWKRAYDAAIDSGEITEFKHDGEAYVYLAHPTAN
jgi:hypothetical protein